MIRSIFVTAIALATSLSCFVSMSQAQSDAIDKKPLAGTQKSLPELQLDFANTRYQAFICWDLTTFKNATSDNFHGRAMGDEPASLWKPTGMDVEQWAQTVIDGKMAGAVLTTKHTAGFCLWDSKYTDYDVASSPVKTDVVEAFVKTFREKGLQIGLYYCMLDYHHKVGPGIVTREGIDHLKNQITELLTNYGPIDYIMLDAWATWPSCPSFDEIQYKEIHDLVKSLQPECLIVNHTYETNLAHAEIPFADAAGRVYPFHPDYKRPTAGSDVMQKGWFWDDENFFVNKPVETFLKRIESYNDHNGVYILNSAINTAGRMDDDSVQMYKHIAAAWEKPEPIQEAGANWGYQYDVGTNLAFQRPCTQSSLHKFLRDKRAYPKAEIAVDGITEGSWLMEQTSGTQEEEQPWWQVDLQRTCQIDEITIYNVTDDDQSVLSDFTISILDADGNVAWSSVEYDFPDPSMNINISRKTGQFVKIQLNSNGSLKLAEVIVKGSQVTAK
ncbi:Alpha-L-fucosidase [Planctomycetes bacterium CA13]|uniref:alpha-L-fucosidase n=1 Tax=Novipirellula herctigrandis TaxID=2527986 RepID=A0A5C5ZBC1_9BACT|nr:Alpha-L-fucosidase [Planctomycetes bacterium CA13]